MKKRFSLAILSLFAILDVKAANIPTIPPQCIPDHVRFGNGTLLLNASPSLHARIFIFNNVSNQMVWLDHISEQSSTSAVWDSQIASHHWSAILLQANQRNLTWTCSKSQDNKKIPLSCEEVLKVCSINAPNNPEKGNFWIMENELSEAVVRYAIENQGMD
jgi:hypothetical protein